MEDQLSRVRAIRECDQGVAWAAQGHRLSRPLADEVIDVLLAARRTLVPACLPHPEHVVDGPSARAVLGAIWTATVADLTHSPGTVDESSLTASLIDLLQRVKEVDERILVAQVQNRDQAFGRVRDALAGLGEAKTTKALIDMAPVSACGLGFDRSIVSRVEDSFWIPERVHVEKDSKWADEILEIGRSQPQVLNGTLVETEIVRRRLPILVDDVQDRPGVHRPIADASMSRSYAAAPVMMGGSVVGFVHVDCYFQQRNLDATDRQVVSMFAEGLSQALVRTAVLDRLTGLRSEVDALSERLSAVGEGSDAVWGGCGQASPQADEDRRPRSSSMEQFLHAAPIDPTLTRREVDVLRLMAAGDTNARIARRLVISGGTVKSHVKHILRKLGAANRAEAVSNWLSSNSGGSEPAPLRRAAY